MQSENIIIMVFDPQKMPKEIAAIIFGKLSFADLIVAKNVCRRFNLLFRPLILDRMYDDFYDNNCAFEKDVWNFGEIDDFISILHPGKCNVGMIATEIMKFADGSREECIWLFVLKKLHFVCKFKLLTALIHCVIDINKISDTTKIMYFRKYYKSPYPNTNYNHEKDTKEIRRTCVMEILMKYEWQKHNLQLFENIIRIVLDEENNVDNLAGLFRRLHFPEGYYTSVKYQKNKSYLQLINDLEDEYLRRK